MIYIVQTWRMLGTIIPKEMLPWQKILVLQLCFHIPQLETATFSTRLHCWTATFQNLFPLYRNLLLHVRCSLWHNNTNPNPPSSTQLPLQRPPLDHLNRSWIKPLLVCSQSIKMISLLIHRFWHSLVARAALRHRLAELGNATGETTPLCMLFGVVPRY